MKAETKGAVADLRGRIKRKLRVSLTDRCNFRCPYCMPDTPDWAARAQTLSHDELFRLLRLFVSRLGINNLRLTGGEPLLRKDLENLIADLNRLRDEGLRRVSLTTNGALLAQRARALAVAGLDDVNISLDALDPDRFLAMSGGRGSVAQVIDGIDAAIAAGLPVKLNSVVIRDHNHDQILPLVRWAAERSLPLRFIEYMPLDGHGHWNQQRVVTEVEILDQLGAHYSVTPLPRTSDPATYYLLDGHYLLGVIPTLSNPFCRSCDRLRLTATGELYNCLFSATGRDLRTPLREGADDDLLETVIRGHVWRKEAGYASTGHVERPISMHALGG